MASDSTATALATIGTVCWCIQLIPQVIRNWYVRDCEGVPPLMFFLFATSGVPFAIYFVDQSANTALMVQPHLFMFFSFVGFWQSLYYPPVSWPFRRCWAVLLLVMAVSAGIEAGCIIPLRRLYNEGTEWPNLIPGIIAAVMLVGGLVPPYIELLKRKGQVLGINFLFLVLDSSGAIFSTASVALEPGKLDILGLVLYIIVLAMEYGIMASHFVWMFRVNYLNLETPADDEMQIHEQLKLESANKPVTKKLRNYVTLHIVVPMRSFMRRCRIRKQCELSELSEVSERLSSDNELLTYSDSRMSANKMEPDKLSIRSLEPTTSSRIPTNL